MIAISQRPIHFGCIIHIIQSGESIDFSPPDLLPYFHHRHAAVLQCLNLFNACYPINIKQVIAAGSH